MTSKNDVTGDLIKSKSTTQQYRDNWDSIFGKNKSTPETTEKEDESKVQQKHSSS